MDSNRRHSFPLQGKSNDDSITTLGPNIFPLTEENLALHTKSFPPSKDARRKHARLFVENQRPVIEMELMLEQQREQEISLFIPILNNEITSNNEEQREKKRNWLQRLTHWIRLDKNEKRRHRSWSAGTEKDISYGHSTTACQKRDSGISLFHNNRRSPSIQKSTLPTAKQTKIPEEELIAFKYPIMVRKSTQIENSLIINNITNTTTT